MNTVAAAVPLVLLTSLASAQAIPTGYQEYFIVGHDDQVYEMLDAMRVGEGGAAFNAPAGMNAVIALTATTDDQVVIYDHWEDGYEADIFAPSQSSTLILGDGDPANGDAAVYGAVADRIDALTALVFASSSATGSPGTLSGDIPYPRPALPHHGAHRGDAVRSIAVGK